MAKLFGDLFKAGGKGTLSIDIGSNSVKFVKLEGGRITDYGLKEMGETPDVAATIRSLIQDYKPARVYSFVSGPSVSLRQAPFPKMSRRELREAILLRLEKYSPFSLDEAILDFRPLGPIKEAGAVKDNVMVVAARKDIVSDHISTIKKAGLEPSGVSVTPFALAAAVRRFARIRPDENIVLLDIGAEFTNIIFMKGDRLDLARTITTAGNSLTEAMTVSITIEEGELSLDFREAEKIKREFGLAKEDSAELLPSGVPVKRLAALQRPALERFDAEIGRTIDYYKREFGEAKIDRILLCGGTTSLKGLKEHIQGATNIPVEVFDPFKTHGLYKRGIRPEEQNGTRLVAALGLLFDHQAIDLLPKEIKAKRYVQMDVKLVILMAILVIPALLIINILLAVQQTFQKGTIKSLQRQLKATEQVHREYFELKEIVQELEGKKKLLRDIVGQEFMTVPLMQKLSLMTPDNFQLKNVSLTGGRTVKISGILTTEPYLLDLDLTQFMLNLERSPLFKEVNLKSKNRTTLMGETVLEFELETFLE